MLFFIGLVVWSLLTVALWWRSDRVARRLRGGRRRVVLGVLLRLGLAAFYSSAIVYPAVLLSKPILEYEPETVPPVLVTLAFLWHPGLLTLTLAAVAVGWVARRHARRRRAAAATPAAAEPAAATAATTPASPRLSRREALGLAATAVPPVAGIGVTAVAWSQRGDFRVNRLDVWLPTLPPDLDGLRVVHLTDLHAGNFFPPEAVDRVVDAVNSLRPELVVFTGDLVDRGLMDRVPQGFRLIDAMRRYPFAMIEGNHDVMGNAAVFERIAKDATRHWPPYTRERPAMPDEAQTLLLDEQKVVYPRGRQAPPVQLLGIAWGELTSPESDPMEPDMTRSVRRWDEAWAADAVRRVAALPRPAGAFPILLAHHPHAFDTAAELSLPLTLAGHTHGGQIMLTDRLGAGPLRFRYWSGVHERAGCQLVISNGLGSWFPLRVGAPAEFMLLTLRAGSNPRT